MEKPCENFQNINKCTTGNSCTVGEIDAFICPCHLFYYSALAEETTGKSFFPHVAKAGAAVNSIRVPLAD